MKKWRPNEIIETIKKQNIVDKKENIYPLST